MTMSTPILQLGREALKQRSPNDKVLAADSNVVVCTQVVYVFAHDLHVHVHVCTCTSKCTYMYTYIAAVSVLDIRCCVG